jgi:hypothetical protein
MDAKRFFIRHKDGGTVGFRQVIKSGGTAYFATADKAQEFLRTFLDAMGGSPEDYTVMKDDHFKPSGA